MKKKQAKAIRSTKGEARPRVRRSTETCLNLPKLVDGRCACKTPSGKTKKLPKDSCGLFTPKVKSKAKSGPVFLAKAIKAKKKASSGG